MLREVTVLPGPGDPQRVQGWLVAEYSYLLCGCLKSAVLTHSGLNAHSWGLPPPSQEVKEAGKLSRKLSGSPSPRYPVVPSPSLYLPAGPYIRGRQLSTHWIKVLKGGQASPLGKHGRGSRKPHHQVKSSPRAGPGEGGHTGVSGAVSQARLPGFPESNHKHKQPS